VAFARCLHGDFYSYPHFVPFTPGCQANTNRPGDPENYKRWRLSGAKNAAGEWEIKPVKPIIVRHDMDNLSLFFQWAK
jgi:hypothetical protein